MLTLSAVAKIEANKMHGDGAWLILLEIQIPNVDTIYLVRNNENITWNSIEWIAFPFDLDDIKETSDGEIPSVILKVSNVTRAMQGYIENANGGVGSVVILRIVHSQHLDLTEPEIEEEFVCLNTKCDNQWIDFELGIGEVIQKRFPPKRYLKNFCPFKFKGIECGLSSLVVGTTCDRTLSMCRDYGNSTRFGGFPAIPQGGLYV